VASSAFSSQFNAESGSLQLSGKLESQEVIIGPAATLRGDGLIHGDLRVDGTVAPGSGGVGTQTVEGAASFMPGSHFLCDVASHTALDRLNVTGTVSGAAAVEVSLIPGAIPVGQVIIVGGPASDFASFYAPDAYTWRLGTTGSVSLTLTHLRGDTDADGLPDWWEMAYFSGSRTAAAPTGDGDVDHVINRDEYGANTDPGNSGSYLRLTKLRRPSASLSVVTWSTAPGRRYAVLRTTNFMNSACTVTSAQLNAYTMPEHSWTNPAEAGRSALYWITAEEDTP
jgi:hypothetical protein